MCVLTVHLILCACVQFIPQLIYRPSCVHDCGGSGHCCSDCFRIDGFWMIGVFRVKLEAGAAVLGGLSEFTVGVWRARIDCVLMEILHEPLGPETCLCR